MNRRSRQGRYSYPFMKDVLRKVKAPMLYNIVVDLVKNIEFQYSIVVDLVRSVGYTLTVDLTERLAPVYTLVVDIVRNPMYALEVSLIGYPITPRNLVVDLVETTDTKYSLIVSLVEGGEDSGCITLDC